MKDLAVFLSGTRVGTLSQSAGLSFAYDEDYLAQQDPTPLSLSMPLRGAPFGHRVTRSWVEGLLPGDPRVRARVAARGEVKASNPLAVLSIIGLDCPGAVQVCEVDRTDEVRHDGLLVPVDEAWIGARLALLRRDDAAWQVADERWSLGGGQSKFTLARGIDGQWYDPRGAAPSTHIVKPGVHHAKHQALNEHVSLIALRGLGIPVAPSRYVEFDGEPAIVVERFDRGRQGPTVVRRHAEDLCQALGNQTIYERDGGPTATQILDLLGDRAGKRSKLRFVEALIGTYLLGSPDGHARNYSVLLEGGQAALAPLYDVASSLPYDIADSGIMTLRTIAIAIGGEHTFGMVGLAQWQRFFAANSIDADWGIDTIKRQATRLPDALADAFAELTGVAATDELRPRYVDAVARSCRQALQAVE
ncbi:MAG: HipA domain-containing protein [Tessaracoccus sp.]|uniref:HipA domain-containing protein n=1 Tax=Tessaracoccus sp. TaxID=1971211 RepID=UPI001ECE7F1F|nr:HipA domain-containing protein [Tessaracoccus sp.]MBK7820660.1 HipA domain-containing protein [Tessaracoccus sp.]